MLPHRRQEYAAGNHFSFSHPIRDPTCPDGMEYGTWAERIKGKYTYFGKPAAPDSKLGAWTRSFPSKEEGREADEDVDGDDSPDLPSPPLWKKAAGSPRSTHDSPDSSPIRTRAQTIAKYRQEMLDMVRDMPESNYELSLRDIVESPRIVKSALQESGGKQSLEGVKEEEKREKKKKKGKKGTGRISRSESMDTGGLLLKLFIPRIPFTWIGGKRSTGNSDTCAKVSPKPMLVDRKSAADGEWWNKEEFAERSSSNGSSSSSSDSSTKSRSRKVSGCYSFFRNNKRGAKGT